ncbi:MAG: hypothetical protein CR967_00130 [Proteobacteria bacterium]|nr:MAG: hypothetical protein CR967_00130 [Pseudomonadota bacterium]
MLEELRKFVLELMQIEDLKSPVILFLAYSFIAWFIVKMASHLFGDIWKKFKERREKPLSKKSGFNGFGVIQTKSSQDGKSLYDYLYEDKQEYFGWNKYQKINPKNFLNELSYLNDENILLEDLCSEDAYPLLLIGEGGSGKTRLSLELARTLNSGKRGYKNWIAYKAPKTLREEDLNALIDRAKLHNKKILLILDYLETLEDLNFETLYDKFMRNDQQTHDHVRWIMTCRSSYYDDYRNGLKTDNEIKVINLSDTSNEWLENWRKDACENIQTNTKSNVPVLAVIEKYLDDKKGALISKDTHHQWIWHILERSITSDATTKNYENTQYSIARLSMLFPMDLKQKNKLTQIEQNIINVWKKDGWVHNEGNKLFLAHDILSDYSTLYELLQSKNAKVSLNEFWLYARKVGLEDSYFISLERFLPIMAKYFSLYALLQEDCVAEESLKNKKYFAKDSQTASMYAMALMSLSLSFDKKRRVFSAKLLEFQIKELEKIYTDERHKFSDILLKYKSDAYALINRAFPYSLFLQNFINFLLFKKDRNLLDKVLNVHNEDKKTLEKLQKTYGLLQEIESIKDKSENFFVNQEDRLTAISLQTKTEVDILL